MQTSPPPLPGTPSPGAASSDTSSPSDALNLRLLAGAGVLTALIDILLWVPRIGGLAVACVIALLAVAFSISATERPVRLYVYLALGLASAGQALLELKPSTIAISFVLLLAIAGAGHFTMLHSMVAQWVEVTLATVFPLPALRRWRAVFRTRTRSQTGESRRLGVAWRVLQIILPAVVLTTVFSMLFAAGNAVFLKSISTAYQEWMSWLTHLDLSFGRFIFWASIFTLLLSLLRPLRTGLGSWVARHNLPRWRRRDETLGRWQSILILGVLNALFCYVNTIDVIYLWSHAKMPAGVNPSAFLHEGVQSLIFAVLLSAVVLVLLFQQRLAMESRTLQWLSTFWVLQNLIVIAGVFRRLKFYVDVYQLTLLRVGVGLFLLLVIAGFVLLCVYFWRGRGLGWLIRTNATSTCLLFFAVQFVDLDGAIADYNVNRWLRGGSHVPDLAYLESLHENAWPALRRLAARNHDPALGNLDQLLEQAGSTAVANLAMNPWRHRELLRDRRSREMLEFLREIRPELKF